MEKQIQLALRELSLTVARLVDLSEWAKLARQEARPRVPPSFQPADHVTQELRMEYGTFIAGAMDVREALERHTSKLPADQLARWRRRLDQLEEQVRQLELTERFISL